MTASDEDTVRGTIPRLHPLRRRAYAPPDARHVAISLARDPRRGRARERRRNRHRFARRKSARLKEGQDFWRLIRDIGARVLPNTAGCHSVKEAVTTARDGARSFRHALDQARGDRRSRHAAARRVRPRRGGADTVRRRLRSVPLYDRGSRRRGAAGRGRLQGADAVGRADRLGQGAQQCVRPARAARAFPRHAADRRRRHRPAVTRRGGDGARLRRRAAQHRRRQSGRSRRHGARLRLRRSRPAAPPFSPGRWSRATWPRPRRRCVGKAVLRERARPLLPHRRQRGLGRAARRRRRATHPAAGQGQGRSRRSRARRARR